MDLPLCPLESLQSSGVRGGVELELLFELFLRGISLGDVFKRVFGCLLNNLDETDSLPLW